MNDTIWQAIIRLIDRSDAADVVGLILGAMLGAALAVCVLMLPFFL